MNNNEELIREQIAAMNANTAAMQEHARALREHTAALQNEAETIKSFHRLIDRLTENCKSGGHIGVMEATDRLGKIAQMFRESADKIENASKRFSDSSSGRRGY